MIFISLLRGINVSGQKKIKMVDLKALYENLGLANVITYIQSGNVIFESENSAGDLMKKIETAIQNNYGFDVPVQVIAAENLIQIASENPFIPANDSSKLHLTLLATEPNESLLKNIAIDSKSSDEFIVIGRAIYMKCPNGYGRTRLSNTFFESKLKIKATTRNWKTVMKVIELTKTTFENT